MYDILNLYAEPYDPKKPLVGVDEKPKQLLGEPREPIPLKPGSPMRYDYEYTRNGTANIFVAVDPKAGQRIVQATVRRTKKDFARFMKKVVDEAYPEADTLRVVVDNLSTHKPNAFYETFDKTEARRLLRKIEFHYTPKHASWLNIAEVEISVMDAECTGTRIRDMKILQQEVQAWAARRNKEKKKINWKFTRKDADKKLSKHYVT